MLPTKLCVACQPVSLTALTAACCTAICTLHLVIHTGIVHQPVSLTALTAACCTAICTLNLVIHTGIVHQPVSLTALTAACCTAICTRAPSPKGTSRLHVLLPSRIGVRHEVYVSVVHSVVNTRYAFVQAASHKRRGKQALTC
jgi:hypothetical protein